MFSFLKKSKNIYVITLIPFLLLSIGLGASTPESVSTAPIVILGGSQGIGVGIQFNEPDAVAISSEGMIFAGDTLNLRIQVYFANGTYSHNITDFASVMNNEVQGIAIDPEGYLRVVELMTQKIKKFDQNGTFISQFGETGSGDGQFQEPQGIAIDSSTGEIYVVDTSLNRVQKFTSEGVFLDEFGSSHLSAPESIVLAHDKVYVCSETGSTSSTIEVFTKTGTHQKSFGLGEFTDDPEGITVDPLGHILVNNEMGRSKDIMPPFFQYPD